MTYPSPAAHRWWERGRHQGLIVVLLVMALVTGLAVGRVFERTPAPTVAPAGGSSGDVRGVTPTSIKIVLYQPPEDDPVSKVVAQFVAPADDNAKAEATVRGFIKALLDGNPAMHGRHIDLVVFTGSANLLDSVAARADAVKIAEEIRPFMVWNGPLAGHRLRRRARVAWRHVPHVRERRDERVLRCARAVRLVAADNSGAGRHAGRASTCRSDWPGAQPRSPGVRISAAPSDDSG